MTQAPIVRSVALQRALAQTVARSQMPSARGDATFAETLAQAQSGATPTRPSVAQAWTVASHLGASSVRSTGSVPADAGNGPVPYRAEIAAAAQRHGIDPALLAAVVKTESNFDARATSHAGARGLTQLMDATARGLGVTDVYDPVQSLEGGANFLSQLLKQFGGDLSNAVAAYNAGPVAVKKYGGIPPYAETQRYVPRVLASYDQFRRSGAFV